MKVDIGQNKKVDDAKQRHLLEASGGAIKALVARVPILGELIAGWDAYRRSQFDLYVKRFLVAIQEEIQDISKLSSNEWLGSMEGKQFARKIFASATDGQLEEKHRLFANAFVNGIENKQLSDLEKLKFVDILRHLSLASLNVLSEMHRRYGGQAHRSNQSRPVTGAPQVSVAELIRELGDKFDPYLIESAVTEMRAVGLFSRFTSFRTSVEGKPEPDSYIDNEIVYTEFTIRFVEFVKSSTCKEIDNSK